MISSMTAFSNLKTEFEHGTLQVELRCVNNRYLDLNLRIPDDFRSIEDKLRELVGQRLHRGKAELKISFKSQQLKDKFELEATTLNRVVEEIDKLRVYFPDMPTPGFADILALGQEIQALDEASEEDTSEDAERLAAIYAFCLDTVSLALDEFVAMRQREGARLAETMSGYANEILNIVEQLEAQQEQLLQSQKEKIEQRLTEALQAVAPNGFEHISGEELSMRIAQETSLFGIRVDIAEEITRLKSHTTELQQLLSVESGEGEGASDAKGSILTTSTKNKNKQSLGRRLDFLFQEMNREINTIGSKASSLDNTQAVIEMKLYVEQLREQALNIE